MSNCSPFGSNTPSTRSLPSASTQSAATTELSLPPETATTALQPLPFSSNQSRIHATTSSFTFFASKLMSVSPFYVVLYFQILLYLLSLHKIKIHFYYTPFCFHRLQKRSENRRKARRACDKSAAVSRAISSCSCIFHFFLLYYIG